MNDTNHSRTDPYADQPWLASYAPDVKPDLEPLPDANLGDLVRRISRLYSDRTAFVTCLENGISGSLTYGKADWLSDAFAAYLRFQLGLKEGERVAVQLPNCNAYPVAIFGILKAGLVLVNVNPLYTPHETRHQLADSGARVLLALDLFGDKLADSIADTAVQTVLLASVATLLPTPKRWLVQGVMRLKGLIPQATVSATALEQALTKGQQHAHQLPEQVPRSRDDLAALQYTGGTTGPAKGAMLSHGNLLANLAQTRSVMAPAIDPGAETVLTALPLYHIFAFTYNLMAFYSMGCRNILCPSPRPPSKLRKAFQGFRVTQFAGVNALFHALAKEQWFRDAPPPLRQTVAGGTALHEPVAEEWRDVVGHYPCEGYGLSETSPVLTVNQPSGTIRLGSIGLPVPGTRICLVDADWQPVAAGEVGELTAAGPQVFHGYWNKPEETERAVRDGFFATGDMAVMDTDGFFHIVDRKKDMIDVSGFNVYPNEVEGILSQHAGVDEAAVIGLPDTEVGGERVCAYVVASDPELTREALIAFARERLTGYKVPQTIWFTDELPKSPVGKVLRKDLRQQAAAADDS